jgi:hypothetical protein
MKKRGGEIDDKILEAFKYIWLSNIHGIYIDCH